MLGAHPRAQAVSRRAGCSTAPQSGLQAQLLARRTVLGSGYATALTRPARAPLHLGLDRAGRARAAQRDRRRRVREAGHGRQAPTGSGLTPSVLAMGVCGRRAQHDQYTTSAPTCRMISSAASSPRTCHSLARSPRAGRRARPTRAAGPASGRNRRACAPGGAPGGWYLRHPQRQTAPGLRPPRGAPLPSPRSRRPVCTITCSPTL